MKSFDIGGGSDQITNFRTWPFVFGFAQNGGRPIKWAENAYGAYAGQRARKRAHVF